MIDKLYGKYRPVCDCCGDMLDSFDSYFEAVRAMKEAGWKTVKAEDGEWENYCDLCVGFGILEEC